MLWPSKTSRQSCKPPPTLAFLPTCKAKRVTYYIGGWPRGELLNTRLYVLVVPSGTLLYEYFNLINSACASIDRYYRRLHGIKLVRRRFRICRLIRISSSAAVRATDFMETNRASNQTAPRAVHLFRYLPLLGKHHPLEKSLLHVAII